MRYLLKVIFVLVFLFFVSPVQAASNQFVTIVNPIRGGDFWTDKNSNPVTNVKKQFEIINSKNLPATWLIRPDAFTDSEVVNFLKNYPSNQEIGLFMEITPAWARDAGVTYHQSANWHSSGSVFLTGYEVTERQKLIDTAFAKFKDIFGYYPKSVGAWWIDGGSLSYMKDKYGIVANMDVADQYTTDNYQVWGQYFSTPFYPSKRNALVPATGVGQKIGVVTIQWAARDPFNSYGNGVLDSTFSVQANDYANKKYHSLDINYFNKLLSIYLDNQNSNFGQVTVGLENDFSFDEYGSEFMAQINSVVGRKNKGTTVVTMSEFSRRYTTLFPTISDPQIIFAEDPLGSGGKVLWYQTPQFRIGWFSSSAGSIIRDLRIYHESTDEPCLNKACPNLNLAMLETKNLDEVTFGDHWIIDEGSVKDIKIQKLINGVEIDYINQAGNHRKITILPNDIKIDNSSLPISVAISQAIDASRNTKKIEGNYNYKLQEISKVFITEIKNVLVFFVFIVLFFYIPGLAILKRANLTDMERYILSWPVGLSFFTLLSFAFGYLHFYYGLLILPVIAIFKVRKEIVIPRLNWIAFSSKLVILVGSISWLLVTIKNGLSYDYGMGFWGAHGHDAIWHLSLIESAKLGLPLENFSFAGMNLSNYHFFYDLTLAAISKLTNIPGNDLYFRDFALFLSISIGLVTYLLAKNWFKSELAATFAVFLIYFGGSFGWLISFVKDRSLGGETLFWAQQGVSTLINPPFAISILIFLAGLFLFQKITEGKIQAMSFVIPLVILWGTLIEFKAYAGLLVLGGLAIVSLYEITRQNWSFLKISLPIALLSAAIFLPNNIASGSLLVFQPFWLIHSMVDSADRLNWIRLSNARILGFAGGNYFKFIVAEVVGIIIFVLGNLGTRFVGVASVIKLKDNISFKIFIISFLSFSLIIPLVFIQKGASFNIVQFFYYFLLIFCFLGAESLVKLSRIRLGGLMITLLIMFTIPTTWDTLHHFLPVRPPAMIPAGEVEGLNFLRDQPKGTVLSYYFDIKNHDKFAPPIPLLAYQSTPYVSAFSGKPEFIADTVDMEILGVDYKGRLQIQKDIFALKEPQIIKEELAKYKIKYIYAPKIANFIPDQEVLGLKKIFGNNEVDIYLVTLN